MKYFKLRELTRSSKAKQLGVENTPNIEEEERLINLVHRVLDPLREWYGKPINVNSGFRNEVVNKAVGGARYSQHRKGEAADISVYSKQGNKELFNYIKDNLPFDQLINEKNYSWVHVSCKLDLTQNRGEILHL